jgi:ubiquinone/menaquinone biosynthesis C-methylase UbiE
MNYCGFMPKDKKKKTNYLAEYLRVAPISHAIWRACEAEALSQYHLPRPLLDLGCGFGEFAGVFFDSMVEVGIDISLKDVLLAAKGKKYKKTECVDARSMRFRDNSFNSVLSVSVLEHIPKVREVLKEVYRVLRPGGKLLFTVPGAIFSRELLGYKLGKRLGFEWLANGYQQTVNHVFKHYNLWTDKHWRKELRRIGFKVKECRGIVPLEVFRLWELGLPFALPSQLGKWLWGKRWVWRPLGLEHYLEIGLSPVISRTRQKTTNWLLLAEK